jgi:type IV pilus assembly protein PilV
MREGHATVQTSRFNSRGFTLIEMMMATLITVVVLLGLLKAVELATEQNVKTRMRDEMAQIAEARMNSFRAMPFSWISTCQACPGQLYTYSPQPVPSNMNGITKQYTVTRKTIVSTDKTAVDLEVRVRSWVYKNVSTAIEVHTVKVQ